MENLFNLQGRKALVTGSSQGIGKAIALGLAECGADLIIHYNNNIQGADKTVEEAKSYGIKAIAVSENFENADAANSLFNKTKQIIGNVDILVLNASLQYRKRWTDVTNEEFDKQVKVNLKISFELMQLFAPAMIKNAWGRILTIGSVQQTRPQPEMIIYSATKAAQMNIVMAIAKDIAKYGVTVNNLSPGIIETNRNNEVLSDKHYLMQKLSTIPCNYIGKPIDCVGATLLLCSEEGRYINGIDMVVDGGRHLC